MAVYYYTYLHLGLLKMIMLLWLWLTFAIPINHLQENQILDTPFNMDRSLTILMGCQGVQKIHFLPLCLFDLQTELAVVNVVLYIKNLM